MFFQKKLQNYQLCLSKLNKPELAISTSLEETKIAPREAHDSSENQPAVEQEVPAEHVEDAGGEEVAGKFWILIGSVFGL